MRKVPLAALLCLTLAAPSGATVRAVLPARVPVGAAPVLPRLVAAGLLPLSAPALSAPPVSLAPVLSAPAGAPLAVPAAAQTLPAVAAAASAEAFAAPLAASAEAPASPERGRALWEKAWSGSRERPDSGDAVPAMPAGPAPAALARPSRPSRLSAFAAAAPLPALAAASAAPGWLASAMPFLQAGGLALGAYGTVRLSRWAIGKLAEKFGWDVNTVALARFVVGAAVWGGAAGYGLSLVGVTDSALFTTLGGSGAAMALAVKDVLGNFVHGVHFLVSRPFTVGTRVVIDDVPGVVHELTLRYAIVRTEQDPPYAFYTYTELTGKSVTITGEYHTRSARIRLRRPALPEGLLKALRDAASPSLWRPAFYSALGIAGLSLLPLARGWFEGHGILSWFDWGMPYATAGLILFLGRAVAQGFNGAIARLAARYGWSAPATTLLKLAASALVWSVAGSFALNTLGVSWAALATSLSVSTIVLGVAVNDYVSAVFQAFLILLLKPFKLGDRIAVGKHEGEVVDITFQHVVLKKDDSSYILLPYASVKGFRSPREYGHKAP